MNDFNTPPSQRFPAVAPNVDAALSHHGAVSLPWLMRNPFWRGIGADFDAALAEAVRRHPILQIDDIEPEERCSFNLPPQAECP